MSRTFPDAVKEARDFEAERRAMLEKQIRGRGIRDERVLAAMLSVPRHEFVPAEHARRAYEDRPLPIGKLQTISQPYIVAAMTVAARVLPGDRILEVGTGSGYQAAVLRALDAVVMTIERDPAMATAARERLTRLGYGGVEVREGDGTEGYEAGAPYDAILVTAAAPQVPEPLIRQLADGGRLVIPVGAREQQELELIFKVGEKISHRYLDPCQFVPLIGKHGWNDSV